jgi:hypothetical protein
MGETGNFGCIIIKHILLLNILFLKSNTVTNLAMLASMKV